jgi:hypothetical protein
MKANVFVGTNMSKEKLCESFELKPSTLEMGGNRFF